MAFFHRLELCKKQDLEALVEKMGCEPLTEHNHNRCQMKKHASDSTPSLKYYKESNSFYCFGCKSGGSTVDWVMGVKECPMFEAVLFIERLFKLSVVRNEDQIRTKLARESADRIRNKMGKASFDPQQYARHIESKLREVLDSIQTELVTLDEKTIFFSEADLAYTDLDSFVKSDPSKADLDEFYDYYSNKFADRAKFLRSIAASI